MVRRVGGPRLIGLKCALCGEAAPKGKIVDSIQPWVGTQYWVGTCCIKNHRGSKEKVSRQLDDKFRNDKIGD